MTPARSGATHRKGSTFALRIQFSGPVALEVSGTSQDRIQDLIPWLRGILTSLRLPLPKSTNFIKPRNVRGTIDMYWDVEVDKTRSSDPPLLNHVITRCKALEPSILTEKSIGSLMVLPENVREIPNSKTPLVMKRCSFEVVATAGASSSRPASTELESGIRTIFENNGLSIPIPVDDPAALIPILSKYIQTLRNVLDSEAAARMKAEAELAEERERHARILQDIQRECREPFVVPALLDAFLSVSHVVENASGSQVD